MQVYKLHTTKYKSLKTATMNSVIHRELYFIHPVIPVQSPGLSEII